MYAPVTERKTSSPKPSEIDYRAALQQLEALPPPVNSEPEWNLNAAEVKPQQIASDGTIAPKNVQEMYDINKVGNTGTTPPSAKGTTPQGNGKLDVVIDEKIKNILSLYSEKEEPTNLNANNNTSAQISSPVLTSPSSPLLNEQKVQNNNSNNIPIIPVASSNTNTNVSVTPSSPNVSISPPTTSVSPSSSSSVISPSLSNQLADPSSPSPIQSQHPSYPNVAPIQNYSSSATPSPSIQEPVSYPSTTVLTPPSSTSVNTPPVNTSYSNAEQTNQFVSSNPFSSNVVTPPVTSPPPSTVASSHPVHSVQKMEQNPFGYQQQQIQYQQQQQPYQPHHPPPPQSYQQQSYPQIPYQQSPQVSQPPQQQPQNLQSSQPYQQTPVFQQKQPLPSPPFQNPQQQVQVTNVPPSYQQHSSVVQPQHPPSFVPPSSYPQHLQVQTPPPQPNNYYAPPSTHFTQQVQVTPQSQPPRVQNQPPQNQVVAYGQPMTTNTQSNTLTQPIQNLQQDAQSKEILNQMQMYFERVLGFMQSVDQRLGNLEIATKDIIQKKNAVTARPAPPVPPPSINNITYPSTSQSISSSSVYPSLSGYPSYPSFSTASSSVSPTASASSELPMSKSEIDAAKKMQELLEKDIEIAKKLQQDLDTQYYDDEVQENQKKTSKDKKASGSATVTKNSMIECPVCNKQFSATDIYAHIDKCMETSNKKPEEKVGFLARLFGKKDPKDDEKNKQNTSSSKTSQPSTTTPTPAPPTTTPTTTPTNPSMPYSPYQMPYGVVNVNGVPTMVYKVPSGTMTPNVGQPMVPMGMQYPGTTTDPYSANAQGMYYYPTMPQYQQPKK